MEFTSLTTPEIQGTILRTEQGFHSGNNVDLKLMSEKMTPEGFRLYLEYSREYRRRTKKN